VLLLSNSTTARLEAYARALGHDLSILKSPQNAAGVWFVTRVSGKVLTHWISLGWTVAEAKERLQRWHN
jgi:hypothetical protein